MTRNTGFKCNFEHTVLSYNLLQIMPEVTKHYTLELNVEVEHNHKCTSHTTLHESTTYIKYLYTQKGYVEMNVRRAYTHTTYKTKRSAAERWANVTRAERGRHSVV